MKGDRPGEFEELTLLAIRALGERTYAVPVQRFVEKSAGRNVAMDAVYAALERPEAKGHLTSVYGEVTSERGGKRKRLFSVTREATQPDADARARIRAGLDARLVAEASAPRGAQTKTWLGIGAVVVGIGAVALWFSRAPGQSSPLRAPVSAVAIAAAPQPLVSVVEPTPAAEPPKPVVAETRKAGVPGPSLKAPTVSSAAPDPAEEITLVRAMQQALRSGNASQALLLAGEHGRRFPKGALIEEREGARAVARCQLAAPGARAGR